MGRYQQRIVCRLHINLLVAFCFVLSLSGCDVLTNNNEALPYYISKDLTPSAKDCMPFDKLRLIVGNFEPKLIKRSGSSRYWEKGLQVILKLSTNDLCGTRLALIKLVG